EAGGRRSQSGRGDQRRGPAVEDRTQRRGGHVQREGGDQSADRQSEVHGGGKLFTPRGGAFRAGPPPPRPPGGDLPGRPPPTRRRHFARSSTARASRARHTCSTARTTTIRCSA